MKTCFRCGEKKPLSEFYKHPKMKDGRLNKCKDCTRADVKGRERALRQDNPEWVEHERARGREKYRRLGYVSRKPSKEQRRKALLNYALRYPEKASARNLSQHIKGEPGTQQHHWSYAPDNAKDVLFLKPEQHSKLHRYSTYDQERLAYRRLDGSLIDSAEACIQYLKSLAKKP